MAFSLDFVIIGWVSSIFSSYQLRNIRLLYMEPHSFLKPKITRGVNVSLQTLSTKCTQHYTPPGPRCNIKTVFPGMGIPMLMIRRSRDRLIFNMVIPILVRHLYVQTPPWCPHRIHSMYVGNDTLHTIVCKRCNMPTSEFDRGPLLLT